MNSTDKNARAEQAEIDASAKWPVLVFFGSAIWWLLAGGVLQLVAAIQLHSPEFLAECAWTTHGRIVPAAQNALVYGWGMNVAFAFGLWLMARLSATTLRHGGWLFVAAKFWNVGVTLGLLGILGGYSTSFELLEMPRFVTLILLIAYAMVGVWGITTFSIRNTENVYASQWYLFGAAFWFPWLYSIAQIMLLKAPVRGVLQPIVNAWYVQGLYGLWFVPIALAAAYYFLPKIIGRPVANYYLAPLAFWWLAAATALSGGSRLIGAPVPVWISTLGGAANFLLVVPVVVISLNLFGTLAGNYRALGNSVTLRFIFLSMLGFVLASVLNFALSTPGFAAIAQLTLLSDLRDWLILYACFSTAMFGAAYFIIPRLTGREWQSSALVKTHFGTAVLGIALLVVALGAGGWTQGHLLNNEAVETGSLFGVIARDLSVWFTLRSIGLALLLLGHVAFLVNFGWQTWAIFSKNSKVAAFHNPPALSLTKASVTEGHA
jgi:cytochrome c oxidase cbb3-type subunit 1